MAGETPVCRKLVLAVWLLAPALPAAAPGAVMDEDEVGRLAEQAGSPASAAALARLLELALAGGDAARARAATEALPRFGEPGDCALERVLRGASAVAARARALELCAARGRREDVGLFVELASRPEPTPLRLLALDAIAADRAALALLAPILRDPDPKVQARALRLLGHARLPAAIERAREILAPDARVEPQLKIAAIEVLRLEGGPDSIRRLVVAAGHELGEARDFALKTLLVMERGAVLLLLVPMLSPAAPANDALVAIDVVSRVGAWDVDEIRAAVRGAVDHPDTDVQSAAVRAIGALGDRDGLARLERAAAGVDPEVAAAAIDAITALRGDDAAWRETLRRMVRAPRVPIRLAAIRALGAVGDRGAVPLLVRLLDDEGWRVRETAADALGELRAGTAIAPLIDHLEGERMRVRAALVRALRRTTGMPFQDVPRDWRRWWNDAGPGFEVPPLEQVEAMETRLLRNAAQGRTRATFYGIPVASDHLALVIDVSGSMAEVDPVSFDASATARDARAAPRTKLDVAKAEVQQLLDRLPDGTSLNLLFFSDDVERWQRHLVPWTRAHAARAGAYVRERRAGGATNLFDALTDALADPQLDTIYLLSDGHPTSGRIVDPVALRAEIRRRNCARNVRIHVVSIGHESALLRHLAADSGGTWARR